MEWNRLALAIALVTLACGAPAHADQKALVGISMPTKSSSRWIADGQHMLAALRDKGLQGELQYADDDVPNQVAQIENMITKGARVLVIAAIDSGTLSATLKKASERGIKVIAYDRLLRGSPHVDAYATFDNFQVGVLQGSYIAKALDLQAARAPLRIELFGGSSDDSNAFYFYNGAMSVLKPYIDQGKLAVASRQTGMDKVATLRWDGAAAQARMDNLLSAYYGKTKLDAVLSPYDGMSIGILSSLKGAGYGTPRLPMPVVTGQDAEIASVKSIIRGEQRHTIFKDTRELARVTAGMAQALLAGRAPTVNDTRAYHNGVKVVPAYLLLPVSVDASNWKQVLVDGSGYYTERQLR